MIFRTLLKFFNDQGASRGMTVPHYFLHLAGSYNNNGKRKTNLTASFIIIFWTDFLISYHIHIRSE